MLYLLQQMFLLTGTNRPGHYQNQKRLRNFFVSAILNTGQERQVQTVCHPYTEPIQDCKRNFQILLLRPDPGKVSSSSTGPYNQSELQLHLSKASQVWK